MKKIMFKDRYGLTKAVLEGRKTQTRRFLTTAPDRYKLGEIVAIAQSYKEIFPDADFEMVGTEFMTETAGWTNKRFVRADLMPHQIRITNVKKELLQDISWEDAVKEGIFRWQGTMLYHYDMHARHPEASRFHTYQEAFAFLIDKVSGKGTWNRNPLVTVYEFELIR